jgi:hypothetical protein
MRGGRECKMGWVDKLRWFGKGENRIDCSGQVSEKR